MKTKRGKLIHSLLDLKIALPNSKIIRINPIHIYKRKYDVITSFKFTSHHSHHKFTLHHSNKKESLFFKLFFPNTKKLSEKHTSADLLS